MLRVQRRLRWERGTPSSRRAVCRRGRHLPRGRHLKAAARAATRGKGVIGVGMAAATRAVIALRGVRVAVARAVIRWRGRGVMAAG